MTQKGYQIMMDRLRRCVTEDQPVNFFCKNTFFQIERAALHTATARVLIPCCVLIAMSRQVLGRARGARARPGQHAAAHAAAEVRPRREPGQDPAPAQVQVQLGQGRAHERRLRRARRPQPPHVPQRTCAGHPSAVWSFSPVVLLSSCSRKTISLDRSKTHKVPNRGAGRGFGPPRGVPGGIDAYLAMGRRQQAGSPFAAPMGAGVHGMHHPGTLNSCCQKTNKQGIWIT